MSETNAPKNPMKTAEVTFTMPNGKELLEHFEGKKVTVVKQGNKFVATYTARGAAKNDIIKRLDTFMRKQELDGKAADKVVEFKVTNLELKEKAPKAK